MRIFLRGRELYRLIFYRAKISGNVIILNKLRNAVRKRFVRRREREAFVVVLECTGPMGPFVRLGPTNDPLSSVKRRPPKWRNRKRSLCSLKFIVCLVRQLCPRSLFKSFSISESHFIRKQSRFMRHDFLWTQFSRLCRVLLDRRLAIFALYGKMTSFLLFIIMRLACIPITSRMKCCIDRFLFGIINPCTTYLSRAFLPSDKNTRVRLKRN